MGASAASNGKWHRYAIAVRQRLTWPSASSTTPASSWPGTCGSRMSGSWPDPAVPIAAANSIRADTDHDAITGHNGIRDGLEQEWSAKLAVDNSVHRRGSSERGRLGCGGLICRLGTQQFSFWHLELVGRVAPSRADGRLFHSFKAIQSARDGATRPTHSAIDPWKPK